MAGLFTIVGKVPETLHGGCSGCCGAMPTCGKMPVGDTCCCSVGDAPYSPGKMPCCETLGGDNFVGTTFQTRFSKTPNLVALVGPLLSGGKLMGPWPGGGAEGIGVEGSVTCVEFPMTCAAGATGRGLSGSGMPKAKGFAGASGEGNLA